MFHKLKTISPLAAIAITFLIAYLIFSGRPAKSYPVDSEGGSPKWDYNTVSVEAPSLQGKLGELANNGWDVFSIERTDSYVDQGNDGKTRLIVEKFQVTARKRMP